MGWYADDNECIECPIGYYRDNYITPECDKCPEGMTTVKNGSWSLDNCTGKIPRLLEQLTFDYRTFIVHANTTRL